MVNNSWTSYPKIYNLGHRALTNLLLDDVLVEEKVDGSQFSFGVFEVEGQKELRVRSKGAQMIVDAPEKMFTKAVETAKSLQDKLILGATYRCEYLAKPKHNTLAYSRIPNQHLILFDVNTGEEKYLSYDEKKAEAERLGLEVVPLVYQGKVETLEFFRSLLERESILGGQKVEGVVIKNYLRFGLDGKTLMGKFVSEEFKEVHAGEWKEANPSSKDIIQQIIEKFRTPARWQKAVIHLRESGKFDGSVKDIGGLIEMTKHDVVEECKEEIKDLLWSYAKDKVLRGVIAGLPMWYKEQLLKDQFKEEVKT